MIDQQKYTLYCCYSQKQIRTILLKIFLEMNEAAIVKMYEKIDISWLICIMNYSLFTLLLVYIWHDLSYTACDGLITKIAYAYQQNFD